MPSLRNRFPRNRYSGKTPRRSLAVAAVVILSAVFFGWLARPVRAQSPDELMPAESAAKAKAILQQAIEGLGGAAYLGVRDSDCSARLGSYDAASGYAGASLEVHMLRLMPDKLRVEYHGDNYLLDLPLPAAELHGRNVITSVYTPEHALVFEKTGVTELPADDLKQYREQLQTDLNYILRVRLNQPGMVFRWGGTDVINLKQVDWVEISDPEHHSARVAIDRDKHLPVRSTVLSRDPELRVPIEDAIEYANYHPLGGVQTAFRITREKNGHVLSQTSYEGCRYNTGISPDLFTREGLEASRTSRKAKPSKR